MSFLDDINSILGIKPAAQEEKKKESFLHISDVVADGPSSTLEEVVPVYNAPGLAQQIDDMFREQGVEVDRSIDLAQDLENHVWVPASERMFTNDPVHMKCLRCTGEFMARGGESMDEAIKNSGVSLNCFEELSKRVQSILQKSGKVRLWTSTRSMTLLLSLLLPCADSDTLSPFPYSGRGMFGKKCVAVESKSFKDFCTDFMDLALDQATDLLDGENSMRDVVQLIRDAQTDNLGKNIVVYWPDETWTETSSDDQ